MPAAAPPAKAIQSMPHHADTIVIGGGTAGAAVAGLLAERSDEAILLLEAGPDYGPYNSGHWPKPLLDASAIGYHDAWDYDSAVTYPDRVIAFERAKVIGGCSAHNGCAAIWGSRRDYDGWAARGNPGWAADDLLPLFRAAAERLRVRRYRDHEITPFQRACIDAAPGSGIPLVDDLNDLDQDVGMAASPVNIVDGVRWNAAFAYLDPVRDRLNVTIVGGALVDRLMIERSRVVAVDVIIENQRQRMQADRVVLAAGTYGSPAILLRSGVGAADELTSHGIAPFVDLPGVGRNLHDHPAIMVLFAGTPELVATMQAFAADNWMPEEQTIAKARSSRCQDGFDLHLYPVGGPDQSLPGGWRWMLPVACMTPRSSGAVKLRDADPSAALNIDHRYLSDPDGHDRAVLADGIRLARDFAAQPSLRKLIGSETEPGPGIVSQADLERFIDRHCVHYYHPVGTCAMGPAADPTAVVDPRGKVYGLDNAFVADCSIMPVIPRANTNLPGLVIGERIGRWLRGG